MSTLTKHISDKCCGYLMFLHPFCLSGFLEVANLYKPGDEVYMKTINSLEVTGSCSNHCFLVNQISLPEKFPGVPLNLVLAIIGGILIVTGYFLVKSRRKSRLQNQAQSASLNTVWKPLLNSNPDNDRVLLVKLIEHDLKGGLNVMSNLLEYISKDMDEKKQSVIQNLNERSRELVENVSQRFIEIVNGDLGSTEDKVNDLISNVINEVNGYYQLKKLKLNVDFRTDVGVKNGEMLKRCIRILLGNAIKFSPSRSDIQINSYKRANMVAVEVIDNGPGLPDNWELNPEKLIRRTGSYGEEGMGIALLTALKICTNNGASLHLENQPGCGTRGLVLWPLSGKAS